MFEPFARHRVRQQSSQAIVEDPEHSPETRHVHVLQQQLLQTLLSKAAQCAVQPIQQHSLHGHLTPNVQQTLTAASAEIVQATGALTMLREKAHLKPTQMAELPARRTNTALFSAGRVRKRQQMRVNMQALSQGMRALHSLLENDRNLCAGAIALRPHWNLTGLEFRKAPIDRLRQSVRRHQLWLRQSIPAGCFESTVEVRDVELHSEEHGSLRVSAGFINRPVELLVLSNRLPCMCAELPFLDNRDEAATQAIYGGLMPTAGPLSKNERNIPHVHCTLLAMEFSRTARTIFNQMSCEIASSWFVPSQAASSSLHKLASLHAQTGLLSVTCDAAPSHYFSLANTNLANRALEDSVPTKVVASIKTTGAAEVGLHRSHSDVDLASTFIFLRARPLTQWLHDAADFDALQCMVRHALDAIAMDFQQPILRVRWQYKGAHAAKRMATVMLEGVWFEHGQNNESQQLYWALAVVLHSGQLRPYYVGDSLLALQTASLFSPDSLHMISASAFGHGLATFKFLVRSAMQQLAV